MDISDIDQYIYRAAELFCKLKEINFENRYPFLLGENFILTLNDRDMTDHIPVQIAASNKDLVSHVAENYYKEDQETRDDMNAYVERIDSEIAQLKEWDKENILDKLGDFDAIHAEFQEVKDRLKRAEEKLQEQKKYTKGISSSKKEDKSIAKLVRKMDWSLLYALMFLIINMILNMIIVAVK